MIPGRIRPPLPEAPLQLSKVLMVEGRDAMEFFEAMLVHLNLSNQVEIRDMKSIYELKNRLIALKNMSGFAEMVTSLGIIRDAEASGAMSAFQSICDSLKQAGFSIPSKPAQMVAGDPYVSVFILPDCKKAGMLEDLCLKAVARDPVMSCVRQYFSCMKKNNVPLPGNMSKAKVHAFLASRERPHLLFGQASHAGYWHWNSRAYSPLKKFLRAL